MRTQLHEKVEISKYVAEAKTKKSNRENVLFTGCAQMSKIRCAFNKTKTFEMLCLSTIRRTLFNNSRIKNVDINRTSALFHTASTLLRREIDDLLAVKSIEENLFENNQHHSSFVSKRELMEKFNKTSTKRHRNKHFVMENKTIERNEAAPIRQFTQQKAVVVEKKPELIIDEEIGFRYTKLQRSDQTFQQLMLMVKSKKLRHVKHQLLLEGRRLIIDAIKCGMPLKYLIFSDIDQLKLVAKFAPKDVTCYKVSQGDLTFWSTLTTCPGLMAIFERPVDMSHIWQQQNSLPIIVICDQIREPNNIGSIIRACASVPVEKVLLTKGCADHWDTKALRGGAGAQFVIPTMGPMSWESIYSVLPSSYRVLVAENNVENVKRILGDTEMDRFVSYTNIPMNEQFVVVIGGETEGVSNEAYELLKMDSNGCCVHIPLANGIDSLNTSTALAIVLFEIKKQMIERMSSSESSNV